MCRAMAGTAAKNSAASSIGMLRTSAIVLPLKWTSRVSRFVAGSVADLARDVDIREEIHLDLDRAVARACLTAAALTLKLNRPGW